MGKVFNVYCYGYSGTFATAADAQAFINKLRTLGCVGKEIVVRVGKGDMKCAVYEPGHAVRTEILKAA